MKGRIEILLEEKKLTQAAFADMIGVGRSSITHLIKGRDKFSNVIASNTLLTFPEINPVWLLKGEGDMYKPSYLKREIPNNEEFTNKDDSLITEKQLNQEPKIKNDFTFKNVNMDESLSFQELNIPVQDREKEEIFKPDTVKTQENVLENNESEINNRNNKKIEKVMFFYTDQTFEEYYPKNRS
jgi:transcriptional regulator with XRE-family HTH domain